jgi:ABC-type multidrug transport system ATPase subunit
MFGLDIQQDSASLQGLMSLCPQFDTLYPTLSAYDHVLFYIKFRGEYRSLSRLQLHELIMEKLKSVDLDVVAHKAAKTFSGGMKRRLSLCLSTISKSSRIVFLDEPTTGQSI